jgi:flagellar assembly protein FliH
LDALIRAARIAPKRTRLSEVRGATPPDGAPTAVSSGASQAVTRPLRDILREEIEREVRAELADEARELYEAERARAEAEGHAAGLAAARASSDEAVARMREELKATAATALAALERAHKSAMARLELSVGEVAFVSICRIIGERALSREFVEALVEQVCAELRSEPVAVARLHPRDIEVLRELFEGDELRVAALAFEVVPDESLELGGCVVEAASGTFMGDLEGQLRRLHALLTQSSAESEERR